MLASGASLELVTTSSLGLGLKLYNLAGPEMEAHRPNYSAWNPH